MESAQLFPIAEDFSGVVGTDALETDEGGAVGRVQLDEPCLWGEGYCAGVQCLALDKEEKRLLFVPHRLWQDEQEGDEADEDNDAFLF